MYFKQWISDTYPMALHNRNTFASTKCYSEILLYFSNQKGD